MASAGCFRCCCSCCSCSALSLTASCHRNCVLVATACWNALGESTHRSRARRLQEGRAAETAAPRRARAGKGEGGTLEPLALRRGATPFENVWLANNMWRNPCASRTQRFAGSRDAGLTRRSSNV